jgi:hypothetical protein
MPVKLGRRQIAAANVALQNRLDEVQVLLAAVALEYGQGGRLIVPGTRLADVADLIEVRSIAVRRLDTGDVRVDFTDPRRRPELEIISVEEPAPCS